MNLPEAFSSLARWSTAFRRRHSKLRHYVPPKAVWRINQLRSKLTEYRTLYVPVRHRAAVENLYHCTFHKAGSQWIKSVLTDLMTYRYCGLAHYHYQSRMRDGQDTRELRDKTFPEGFPAGTIVTPLYITYPNFTAMPKPEAYRAFFVLRDPRDMLVSWYFSTRYSHVGAADSPIARRREALAGLSKEDGLLFAIDHWQQVGIFDEQRAWFEAGQTDPHVLTVRYEDFVGADPVGAFAGLFRHLDIQMPPEVLTRLVEAYSFKRLSGRKKGEADEKSHLRKGTSGDWRNHFTPRVSERFVAAAGDVSQIGYAPT